MIEFLDYRRQEVALGLHVAGRRDHNSHDPYV
jgi:hypothetical protein